MPIEHAVYAMVLRNFRRCEQIEMIGICAAADTHEEPENEWDNTWRRLATSLKSTTITKTIKQQQNSIPNCGANWQIASTNDTHTNFHSVLVDVGGGVLEVVGWCFGDDELHMDVGKKVIVQQSRWGECHTGLFDAIANQRHTVIHDMWGKRSHSLRRLCSVPTTTRAAHIHISGRIATNVRMTTC